MVIPIETICPLFEIAFATKLLLHNFLPTMLMFIFKCSNAHSEKKQIHTKDSFLLKYIHKYNIKF